MSKEDDKLCGLKPLTSGEWDPFLEPCIKHDERFTDHYSGKDTASNWVTQRDFVAGVVTSTAENVLKAAYSILMLAPYIVIGAGGGAIRWWAKTPGTESKADAVKTLVTSVKYKNQTDEIVEDMKNLREKLKQP